MKAHANYLKQSSLLSVSIIVMLLLLSITVKAQNGVNVRTMELRVTNDELNQGVGAATLFLDNSYLNEFSIVWRYDDYVNENAYNYYDVLSINHLHEGRVWVQVTAISCNLVVYEKCEYIYNMSNSLTAIIYVTTNTQSCDNVSAELTVVPRGGVPPYEYEWGTNHKTIYQPGYYKCLVRDSNNNFLTVGITLSMKDLQCSVDPNEIIGPVGFGEEQMIAATQKIPYTITFENDPEYATAPASRVEIEYPIPTGQRLASFRLSDFGFGQFVFTVPSNTSSYYQRFDMSDSLGVWVDVTAGIDIIHNKAFWVFQSIDPATGAEPQSSQLGFLLVNDDEGRGEGYVSFFISPADGVHTGDTTSADATIVFDDNAPIGTNVWTNVFDAVAPTSTIANTNIIETDSTNCVISFSSQDDLNGSGVHSIELFVSVNGEPYVSAGSYAPETEVGYHLMNGSYYRFISIATDNVGNVEDFKTVADAVVDYSFAPSNIVLSKSYFFEKELIGSTVGELSTIDVGDIFTYQLVAGEGSDDNELFAISGTNLVTNADFNCEERLDYSVRIRSTDVSNLYVEKSFDISMIKTNQTYDLNYEGEICQGDSFIGYGWSINLHDSVPGTYSYVRELQTVRGCDSIRTLTVSVQPSYAIPITEEIDFGEDYTSNGFNIVNPEIGMVYDTLYLQTVQGCDSIITLELTVNPEITGFSFFVEGYGESTDAGWKFIASPVAGSIVATTVDNIFSATAYDLYSFNQGEDLEWINYKSEPFELENGQGYLYATKEDQTLVFRGIYNNAETQEVTLVYTEDNPAVAMRGWNLIGNPFTVPAYVDRSYYTMNEDGTAVEPNAASSSTSIPVCNGVMVKAESMGETVTFSRVAQQNAPNQGSLQITLSQVTDRVGPSTGSGTLVDKAIVSFNAGDPLGKYALNESNAQIYIPQGGKDYAIAFAGNTGEIPLNFKTTKNGEYTIAVNTEEKEFYYLHLIDNLTGVDVDLLALRPFDGTQGPQAQGPMGYTFEARTTDYASRFLLRFIPKDGPSTGSGTENFAYNFNGTWIIANEGEATLQVVDVLGHLLSSETFSGSYEKKLNVAPGVYMLRLINGDNIKVQKIIVE